MSSPSFSSVAIDAYVPYRRQRVLSAVMIVALSAPMALVVPLFVGADSTNTAKPRMKESATTAPTRWVNESFLTKGMPLFRAGDSVKGRRAGGRPF